MDPWTAAKKSFTLVWLCHQLLSGSIPNSHLPWESRQSRLSANDIGDNEMIPGVCTNILKFNPQLRKTPETIDKGIATSHLLKWGPLPPKEVGRIACHVRKDRRKGRSRVRSITELLNEYIGLSCMNFYQCHLKWYFEYHDVTERRDSFPNFLLTCFRDSFISFFFF